VDEWFGFGVLKSAFGISFCENFRPQLMSLLFDFRFDFVKFLKNICKDM
jgi:hypothetical protein